MSENENQNVEEIEVGSIPSPPDTASWFEYSWELQQKVPERLEDAAKFLSVMISITLTIVTTAVKSNPVFVSFGLLSWLLALFLAFFVLFPRRYRFSSMSVESVKRTHALIIRRKQFYLLLATVLYFLPFVYLLIFRCLHLLGVLP